MRKHHYTATLLAALCVAGACDNPTSPGWTRTKIIAFRRVVVPDLPGPSRHYLVLADRGGRERVLYDAGDVSIRNLAWSPTGDELVIIKSDAPEGETVSIIDAESGLMRHLDVPANAGTGIDRMWSPTGDHLAFRTTQGLQVVTRTGVPVATFPSVNYFSWAPSGDELVLVPYELSDGLIVAALDGTTRTVATAYDPHYADWSPRGDQIVFVSHDGNTSPLHLLNVHTGDVELLAEDALPWAGIPLWSPDGESIMVVASREIQHVDVGTEAVTRIEVDPASDACGFAWSPDSRNFAFCVAGSPHGMDIRIIEATTGDLMTVIENAGDETLPSLRPGT